MNRAIISAFMAVAAGSLGLAQPISKTPAEAEATIGGKTIVVKYQAASAHGRTIFGGAGALLQPNTVWRAGAPPRCIPMPRSKSAVWPCLRAATRCSCC